MGWTRVDIPSQSGRLAVVTGATGGLGYETARALAAAGAEVVLAGRSETKGAHALARLVHHAGCQKSTTTAMRPLAFAQYMHSVARRF